MSPLPSPQQLRYLLALAELNHFGRAADACAVTQSTLSAGILALERQLDAAILDRGALGASDFEGALAWATTQAKKSKAKRRRTITAWPQMPQSVRRSAAG